MKDKTQEKLVTEDMATWLVLFSDGRYLELYNTKEGVEEWLAYRMGLTHDTRTYRLVKWTD